MKIKQLVKLIVIIILISFISLYTTTIGGYYENYISKKNTLTEEAIKRFENDVREGKPIVASNYIEEEKTYGNKAAKLASEISKLVSLTFEKVMKFIFNQIESTINS